MQVAIPKEHVEEVCMCFDGDVECIEQEARENERMNIKKKIENIDPANAEKGIGISDHFDAIYLGGYQKAIAHVVELVETGETTGAFDNADKLREELHVNPLRDGGITTSSSED